MDLWFPCQGFIKVRFLLIISLTGKEDQSTRSTDGWPTSFLLIQIQVVKYGVRDFENWVERYRLKSCRGEGGIKEWMVWIILHGHLFVNLNEWLLAHSFIHLSLSLFFKLHYVDCIDSYFILEYSAFSIVSNFCHTFCLHINIQYVFFALFRKSPGDCHWIQSIK